MPTNNKVALQPCWDNSIRSWPTPTLSALQSPWAARASVLKFNAEAMGKVLSLKAQVVAKEVQLSSMRGYLTENGGDAAIDNFLSFETADAVLAAAPTRSHDVEKHIHAKPRANLSPKMHRTANSGLIPQEIIEVQFARRLEDTCGRESTAK